MIDPRSIDVGGSYKCGSTLDPMMWGPCEVMSGLGDVPRFSGWASRSTGSGLDAHKLLGVLEQSAGAVPSVESVTTPLRSAVEKAEREWAEGQSGSQAIQIDRAGES